MAKSLIGLLILVPLLAVSICEAAKGFHPISDSHRSAALELFVSTDGSFGSLEETYEAFRSFEVLGIDKGTDVNVATCKSVSEVLVASAVLKDLFYALRVNSIIKCGISKEIYEGLISRLKAALVDARSLHDYYYAIGSMKFIKDQSSEVDILIGDADAIFQSIKALSQSDGRWRFSSSNPESSTYAAGLALEALAGVISLSSTDIDQNLIGTLKNDILKLLDDIEKYDDGAFYFDDKVVESNKDQGPLTTTSSVIRGLAAVSAINLGSLNLPGDRIMGLAKFFLGIGIPGDTKDFFNQLDSLAFFENNRFTIPLMLYLPASVLSLTKKDQLKVRVSTVLGSEPPSLSVKLVRAIKSSSKDSPIIENQELKFDSGSGDHLFEALSEKFDVGHYLFTFESILHDSANKAIYTTGGLHQVPIIVTGDIEIDNAETAIFDSDLGSIEIQKKLELTGESAVSLSANHLQKMRLSFQLATPHGHIFRPHQAFLKLSHESGTEHVFVVGSSGKEFEIILDFLGLVEKFFYLSGRYGIQLTVGDSVMENSFLRNIGYIDLDLPEAPENSPRPPPQAVDPYSRYGPKAEISHIFRTPDKRPPKELSLVFLGLTLLPFIGFLVGLMCLGVNLKNFPTSPAPATFAFLFECGVGAVLLLYVFFWLKLDLFTTLRILGVLGILLIFVGHRILSHLASASAMASAKVKSA